ncbi:MAG: sigma factor-like helix-turn-helix DNA-binding protein [Bariatricus sp.]
MDKHILSQYIDACELIKETKDEIRKLKKQRKRIEQDVVKGSSPEFPYTMQSFHTEGIAYSVLKDPRSVEEQEKILERRIEDAAKIKLQVEEWMLTIPQRMQRIIRYRFFEEKTWSEVAARMGRKATADGIRMEFTNFMKAA